MVLQPPLPPLRVSRCSREDEAESKMGGVMQDPGPTGRKCQGKRGLGEKAFSEDLSGVAVLGKGLLL